MYTRFLKTRRLQAVKLVVLGAAVFLALAPFPKAYIERFYSTFLYIHIQRLVTRASNLAPFSLFDVLVIAIAAAWLVALTADIRRRQRVTARVLMRSVVWGSVLYIAFVCLWGFNYRRVKLADKLEIDSSRISPDGVFALAATSIEQLNSIYGQAHADSREASPTNGFDRAQRELGSVTTALPGRPKSTLLNPFFRWTGVSGMTDPYFLEVLIDDSVLPIERPFVIAHEWGHLAGFADESEANFVGWLTCVHGSAADQYSAWLFVFQELMPVIRDPDRSELVRRLTPGPLEDLRAIAERERRQVSPRASRISSLVYDRYLKANRIPSGVANYREVAGLLLGVQFGPDWAPKLKSSGSIR
jgi:Protein of unknown function (DUF3810)